MNEVIPVLLASVLLVGIWWLYFIEYRNYRLDKTRQRLFHIRDSLFQEAESGALPFDSKAYAMTRKMLNGSIRFAHQISVIRLYGMIYAEVTVGQGRRGSQFSKEFADALTNVGPEAKKAVERARLEMHEALFSQLVFNSIALTVLFAIMLLVFLPFHWGKTLRKRLRRRLLRDDRWTTIDAETETIGNDHALIT